MSFTYPAANAVVAVGGGTFGACGTNACHNNGTSITTGTPAVTAYSWNTTQTDCVTCHLEAGLASNAHGEHLRFPGAAAACVECHAGATAATHINTSVNLNAAGVDYSRGAVVGIASFGESAPAPDLYRHFGITAEAVAAAVRQVLARSGR